MGKKFRIGLKYNHGHFDTKAELVVSAKGEKSAKTKALKLAKIRAKEDKMEVDSDSIYCSLIGE